MPNYRRIVTKAITVIAGRGNPSLQLTKIKMSFRGGAKSADRLGLSRNDEPEET
jgi:hypothetical protein